MSSVGCLANKYHQKMVYAVSVLLLGSDVGKDLLRDTKSFSSRDLASVHGILGESTAEMASTVQLQRSWSDSRKSQR